MKIAILTGQKAFPIINELVRELEDENTRIKVIALPISIIGHIHVKSIAKILSKKPDILQKLKGYDVILIPGNVDGNAEDIERLVNKPVYKASKEADDLEIAIKLLKEKRKLSHTQPADELIKTNKRKKIIKALKEIYSKYQVAFKIGDIDLPLRGPPIYIASETTTTLPPEKLPEQVKHYEESGADIIIAGIPVDEEESKSIERIKTVKKTIEKAELAIDTSRPKIIKKAMELGAELGFSLHQGNIEKLREYRNKAFVVIPGNPYEGITPSTLHDIIIMLKDNIEYARKKGYSKLIADLILAPPGQGLDSSFYQYKKFAIEQIDIPIMMGLANVIELIDADSPGMNMILTQIANELGASLLLVSEESWKAKNSTLETRIATLMSSISTYKKKPPLNLGLDLLIIKEKKPSNQPQTGYMTPELLTEVPQDTDIPLKLDKWGYVTISVDHNTRYIYVCLHEYSDPKPKECYYGRKAPLIYKTILRSWKTFSQEHAAYLGYELAKAEIALITGKKYIQDDPILIEMKEKYAWILKEYRKIREYRREK